MPAEVRATPGRPASLAGFDPREWNRSDARGWQVPPAPPGVAPLLALCKSDAHWDVLYPNMYFMTPQKWRHMTAEISQEYTRQPWAMRKPRMWWRGSLGKFWPGGQPRATILGRYAAEPWANFAFTDTPAREMIGQWLANATIAPQLSPGLARVRVGSAYSMSMAGVAQYQYAAHLPGFFSGTYSRTLQFLLWSGATIFIMDSPWYEFYYHHLVPWRDYVPFNESNLPARFAWARENRASAAKIAWRGARAARSLLTAEAIARYWLDLLPLYASLQRFAPGAVARDRPARLCTCWRHGPRHPPPEGTLPGTKHCGALCHMPYLGRDPAYKP